MHRYTFSKVFGPATAQKDLYKATAEPLVQGLIEGQNGSPFFPCFAHASVLLLLKMIGNTMD